jgi:F-type H+-transporting ATPase subunit delta
LIRRFARPYAKAIFDVAGSPAAAQSLVDELQRFDRMRRGSRELQEVFANPGIEASAKQAIGKQLATRLGLSPMGMKIVEVLVSNHRLNDVGAIVEGLSALVHEAQGMVVAAVRSAHKLSAEEILQLKQTLEKKVGKRVEIQATTDPELLGGFVAQIGSEILNASVVGKIDKFRRSLS